MQPSAPPQRRIFLSCVSHEFRAYRDYLAASLAQPGVELRRQEDFVNAGRTTLDKLNDYIRTCDAVIHLIGDGTGAHPPGIEAEAFLAALPDFASKLGINDLLVAPGLSYTQWEAWLAIYHKKPLGLYRAADVAQRELGFASEPGQVQRQLLHWQRLKDLGRDRKDFVSPHDLSIEVLRALPLMVPGFAENVRNGEFRDRNLLFAVLALQDEILSRENFVRVCTLWGGDTSQSLPELMQQEGLLSHDDRQLVEARIARKLAHKGGDIRQTLAECIGGDIRQSLGDSLDPSTFASLPDSLAAISGLKAESGAWRYHLTRTHGVGGLGVVSVAEDASLERSVAVKRLRPERMLDPMAIERFVREARITGRLQHPNIVPVYELGLTPDDQIPFYAMRFIGHRTLHDAITQHYADTKSSASERNLRFRELLQSFLAVCNAVAFAHDKGVIHRDLKPANVMIGDFGEVILLDWGLAKRIGDVEIPSSDGSADKVDETVDLGHTLAGARLGSPAYMAPEQAAGQVDLHGPLTDIYGLGAILYEILTGDVPFTGGSTEELLVAIQERPIPDPRVKNDQVSLALSAICRKALAKQPEDRYASTTSLADDVQHWLADEPVSVLSESLIVRMQRKARKNPGLASAIAASIIVSALGLATGLYFVNGQKNETELALRREAEQRQEAVKQKTAAEESSRLAARRFDEKRGALDQMLTTFSDDSLKVQPGSQPIRKRFLEEGIEQYSRMLADRADDTEVLRQTASANQELGMVLAELGDVAKGMEALHKAVVFSRKAVEIDGSAQNRITLGNAIYELGQAHYSAGRMEDAARFGEESRTIFGELLKAHQDSADCKAGLGRALILCSLNRKLGDGGKPEDKQAIELLRQAVAASPKNAVFLSDLGRAINAAVVLRDGNKAAENQITEFNEAANLQQRSLELQPTLTVAQTRKTRFVRNIAYTFKTLERPADGLKVVDSAIAIARTFADNNPAVPDGQMTLADLLAERASLLGQLKRASEAKDASGEAVRVLEALVRTYPGSERYAIRHLELLIAAAEQSRYDADSLQLLARASEAAIQALERHPTSTQLLGKGLYAFQMKGSKLSAAGRLEEASATYQKGVEIFQMQSRLTSEIVSVAPPIDYLFCVRGVVATLVDLKKFKEATVAADECLKGIHLKELLDPNSVGFYFDIQNSRLNALQAAGDNQMALEQSFKVRDEGQRVLAGDKQANWSVYVQVLETYQKIARLARKTGDANLEFSALLDYFSETEPYVNGRDHKDLKTKIQGFSVPHLEMLRSTMEALPERKMKRFTIPVTYSSGPVSQDIYVTDSWEFLSDQFRSFVSAGGNPDKNSVESFERIHRLAVEHQMSLADLACYALGNVPRSAKSLQQISQLAEARQRLSAGSSNTENRIVVAEQAVACAQSLSQEPDPTRALPFIEEAKHTADTVQTGDQVLAARLDAVRYRREMVVGQVLIKQKRFDEAYATLLSGIRIWSHTLEVSAEEKWEALTGLGVCCEKAGRKFETFVWLMKAAEMGSPTARMRLSGLINEEPTLTQLLPETVRRRLEEMVKDGKELNTKTFKDAWHLHSALSELTEKQTSSGKGNAKTNQQTKESSSLERRFSELFKDDYAVMLFQGKNTEGKDIYVYTKVPMQNIKLLYDALNSDGNFNSAEFGEDIASGYGEPPVEVKKELAEKYKMLDKIKTLRTAE